MQNPDRILIVRLSHLGDVVHALGVFHALRAAFPAAKIGWAVQTEFAPLVQPLPGLARVISFERRGGARAWLRLRTALADFAPDWCVDAQGNAKSAMASWLSRAPRRVAPAPSNWQEPWAAWSATEHAPPLPPRRHHAMERMQQLARHLAPDTPLPLRLDAAPSAGELVQATSELERRLPRNARAPVLLHLSSPDDVRGWPGERWLELARALARRGRSVLLLSGPAEEAFGRRLAEELAGEARVSHWIGQRGLRALAATFCVAAQRDLALVACDSGPMHLAAAHGLRVVALAGPQSAALTGPWPPASWADSPHAVVRSSRELPCAPCLRRTCGLPEGPVCMGELATEDVLAALERAQ